MSSIRLLFSDSYDPWFNLAAENYIFHNMPKYQCILFLWRNCDTVVIGRAQNPWKECNTRRMDRDGVRLARRSSGGGAVFHDLGNTCFTFMSSKSKFFDHDDNFSTKIVLDALHRVNIDAFVCGRNDILVKTNYGNRKISGSAYRRTNCGKFHHGTLLLHTDLNKLVYYLTPDEKKLQSKGITSIRSRVVNLIQIKPNINHEMLCQSLKESFFNACDQEVISEIISPKIFSDDFEFLKLFLKQSSWKWNFGLAPDFSHELNTRFDWGGVSFFFDIENGTIVRSCMFTDSLYPDPLEELSFRLINVPYNPKNIRFCCKQWMKRWLEYPELTEISKWLEQCVS
ncbi:lipoate--protein ligase [Blochmannia endosymbiont of Polyrhachis (Hedomyrma) turneri]|uniref:lipoate--protein ligase n=1 Tax=Blochmannia endosymbiont of Polyrhachis (Hedomyrma) turneri TaxID=1505596 RepID=UPI00061A66F6|nr:lipoate--protein ligase [Blochmannia endosymbiont of Polyrhachis (Hedomyrma) turneri]AKC59917.1 lipoate-protein ligase A [Blochmannia endosymbiont of Polyrhachis (Hedomyrma) turneri]